MDHFDLDSLLRFTPPRFLCERCSALLTDFAPGQDGFSCPMCGVQYVADAGSLRPEDYLRMRGLAIDFPDVIGHSQQLARIARQARESLMGKRALYPPMRALLEALGAARHFVHFTTFGISAMLIGALKMTALRVDVRGVVSGVKQNALYQELTGYMDESPRMVMRVFTDNALHFPHQKIIVIDGLIAFKGSANLTDFAWRKAAQGHEVIELVTDVAEVVELHNRFFSPVWAALAPPPEGSSILMTTTGQRAPE
jgi:hypothetical protein